MHHLHGRLSEVQGAYQLIAMYYAWGPFAPSIGTEAAAAAIVLRARLIRNILPH